MIPSASQSIKSLITRGMDGWIDWGWVGEWVDGWIVY